MKNAESQLTDAVRKRLEGAGAHCIKLSDRFTRGVPDLNVTSDRMVMVEFKVLEPTESVVMTWKDLGMTGLQDHHVRHMCRRAGRSACCLTGLVDGTDLKLWLPIMPMSEKIADYRLAAQGEAVIKWVMGS